MKKHNRIYARALLAVAAACGFAAAPKPSHAAIGALDNVPAATLLLPYFEVDLDNPNGAQTTFTVTNAEAAPVLARVTLWTDLGKPTLAFDVYLGGYGASEVDLRLAFEGALPRTSAADAGQGPFSAPATTFPSCPTAATAMTAPFPITERLADNQIAHLRAAHTGKASTLYGGCVGAKHGDAIARGYVTVDTVNQCSAAFPGEPGYFVAGGNGIASNRNALFGKFTMQERATLVASVSNLVAIEASDTSILTSSPGMYTFYGRLVGGNAADNREPLGTVWQARLLDVAFFEADTELVVWREPASFGTYACSQPMPTVYPLGQIEVAAFNEEEQVSVLNTEDPYPNPPPPPVLPVPYATQRVSGSMFSPFEAGFVQLNLNRTDGVTPIAALPGMAQSYVLVRNRMVGVYGAATPATRVFGPQHQNGPTQCSLAAGIPYCSSHTPVIGH